jgi:hypothetical protein
MNYFQIAKDLFEKVSLLRIRELRSFKKNNKQLIKLRFYPLNILPTEYAINFEAKNAI